MARTIYKSLTTTTINNLKYSAKAKPIPDGNGLFILPLKSGKAWLFSYTHPITKARITKKRIGYYPEMGLAEARKFCEECRNLLLQNIDPFEHFAEQKKEQERRAEPLQSFAYKWADWKQSKGKFNNETKIKTLQRLEKHLFPRFKGYTLEQFKITDTIERVQDLEKIAADTLKRILGNLIEILDYAVLCGRISHNPITPIQKAFSTIECKHQPTILPRELANFMQALQKSNRTPQIKLLIEWQLVTMLRPFEAVAVQWSDIDWESKILTIPAERMKGGKREHSVPLSSQALQILEEMKLYNGHHIHVFTGRNDSNKPANSQTVNNAIKKIERGKYRGILTAHGLRSIASTYLNELFTDEPLVIEACLSHVGKDAVRNAYFRGSYINRRKELMQVWSDFVEQCKKG